ncbi:hypothetical protein NUACC26_071700 [Scytonema sp. NUACC26]
MSLYRLFVKLQYILPPGLRRPPLIRGTTGGSYKAHFHTELVSLKIEVYLNLF